MRNATHFHEQQKTRERSLYYLQSEAKRKKKPKKIRSHYYSRYAPQKKFISLHIRPLKRPIFRANTTPNFVHENSSENGYKILGRQPLLDYLVPPVTFVP